MKLGHELRKKRFDIHDRYTGIYLRHIFTKYFLFLLLLLVYVDIYLNQNNILTTRFFISKCACAKIDDMLKVTTSSLETVPILDIHGLIY